MLSKTLLLFGVVLIILGAIFLLVGKLPFSDRLPGDIVIQRKNIIGSGLAISLFIFPLNFFNRSAHGSIMHSGIFCYIF